MPETVACPSCGQKLNVPDHLIGQQVRCAKCQNVFTAQAEAPSAPPPPPRQESNPLDFSASPEPGPPRRPRDDDDDYGRPSRRGGYDEDYPRRGGAPHRGAVVLTLGIISLVVLLISCCPATWVMAPIALVMNSTDQQEMARGRMDPSGKGLYTGGVICAWIALGLSVLCTGLFFLRVLVGAAGDMR